MSETWKFHLAVLDKRFHLRSSRTVKEFVVFREQLIDILISIPPEPGNHVGIEMSHPGMVQPSFTTGEPDILPPDVVALSRHSNHRLIGYHGGVTSKEREVPLLRR